VPSPPAAAASSLLRAAPALLVTATKRATSSSKRPGPPPSAQSTTSAAYAHKRSARVPGSRQTAGLVLPSRPSAGRPVASTVAPSVGPHLARPDHQHRRALASSAKAQRGGYHAAGLAALVVGLALLGCLGVLATLALVLLRRRA
jgi:hypothetical protein